MNYYYEICDILVDKYGTKYLAELNVIGKKKSKARTERVVWAADRELMQSSDRVWAESDGHVFFVKNRFKPVNTTKVDMKEFFIVKLKSQELG